MTQKIYNPCKKASINNIWNGSKIIFNCGNVRECSEEEAKFLFKKYPWLILVSDFVPFSFRSDYIPEIDEFKKWWEKFNNNIGLIQDIRSKKYIVVGNKKHWIPNPETRNALGYDIGDFRPDILSSTHLDVGNNVTNVKKAKLVRLDTNRDPFYVVFECPNYEKRHIPDEKTLFAMGRKQNEVEELSKDDFDRIPIGKNLRPVEKWDNPNLIIKKKGFFRKINNIIKHPIIAGSILIIVSIIFLTPIGEFLKSYINKQFFDNSNRQEQRVVSDEQISILEEQWIEQGKGVSSSDGQMLIEVTLILPILEDVDLVLMIGEESKDFRIRGVPNRVSFDHNGIEYYINVLEIYDTAISPDKVKLSIVRKK